jgi:hypothetical protein
MRKAPITCAVFVAAIWVLAWGGCASKPPVEPTGYLGDYSEFQPDPQGTTALIYRKSGLDLARYQRVMIDPVVVVMSADAGGRPVNPENLLRLTRYLRTALVVVLRDAYPVVEEPGEGVLRVRAAITDVIPTRPGLNTMGTLLVPVGAVSLAKRAITGTDLFVGQVAIEAEAVDSETNERLMARVDRKAGRKFALKEGMTTWGHVERAFREWAIGFRLTMDAAHSQTGVFDPAVDEPPPLEE